MTAKVEFDLEQFTICDGQSKKIGGVIVFSQKGSTWVHPVSKGVEVNGKAKVKEGAVGLYCGGSSVEPGIGFKVEHLK